MVTSVATGSAEAMMQPAHLGTFAIGPSPSPQMRASTTQSEGLVTVMMSMKRGMCSASPWLWLRQFWLTDPTQFFSTPEIGSM